MPLPVTERDVVDAGTAVASLATAVGVTMDWLDLLNAGYSGLMAVGGLVLVWLCVGKAYRDWRAAEPKTPVSDESEQGL